MVTSNCEATIDLLGTLQFIHSIGTELALAAYTGDPFDSDTVTLLPELFHIFGYGHDHAGSFMTGDTLSALLHFDWILIVKETFVGATNATIVDLAEDLARSRLGDGNGCDFAFGGLAFTLLDASLLFGWKLHGGRCGDGAAAGCP